MKRKRDITRKVKSASTCMVRTYISVALKVRKHSKSDLVVVRAKLTSGNRWLERHLKLPKGSTYHRRSFTPRHREGGSQ